MVVCVIARWACDRLAVSDGLLAFLTLTFWLRDWCGRVCASRRWLGLLVRPALLGVVGFAEPVPWSPSADVAAVYPCVAFVGTFFLVTYKRFLSSSELLAAVVTLSFWCFPSSLPSAVLWLLWRFWAQVFVIFTVPVLSIVPVHVAAAFLLVTFHLTLWLLADEVWDGVVYHSSACRVVAG